MASTVFSSFGPQRPPEHNMDERLDAARALLGVSPNSVVEGNESVTLFGGRAFTKPDPQAAPDDTTEATVSSSSLDSSTEPVIVRRPRSNSAGLDALAFFATKEQASMESQKLTVPSVPLIVAPTNNGAATLVASPVFSSCSSSSSDDDSEAMPPPPPRMRGRPRSVSNPEGMEKFAPRDHNRLHFVLPASILEEELAEASAAMKAKEGKFLQLETQEEGLHEEEDEEEDESDLDQDELLRRARSRLLEDLSESSVTGDKGVLTLPHALTKYKEVYNKNGRIGIYTPSERAAIINRFHGKRSRRVWNKKIRYNCRKNLADRRMRVKGRFVKRSTEQAAKSKTVPSIPESEEADYETADLLHKMEAGNDEDMPDVNDPEAGFCPTEDQPYRRLRRHTIT